MLHVWNQEMQGAGEKHAVNFKQHDWENAKWVVKSSVKDENEDGMKSKFLNALKQYKNVAYLK